MQSAHVVLSTVRHVDKSIFIFVLLVDAGHTGTVNMVGKTGERVDNTMYDFN